ncbi:MAG: SAM-dependent methyltransferase [Clostridia bacterium]|nr:SAM-dependent methyltransferase [Clostridia bacterium]MBQ4158410.1 SAM-dependent methyltransferase [Clostridia bacterium]
MLTDDRLTEIINMLPASRVIADIGADHGRLGAQLLLSGKCEKVWFSDISAPSLDKARSLIKRLALNDKAEFFVGDGALALPEAPDAAVIAGMGGVTIAEIIENSKGRLRGAELILQPNVGCTHLRKKLSENGWVITDERAVRCARRWYVLLKAEEGKSELSFKELVAGPVFLRRMDENFRGYALFRLRVIEKALKGALKSESAETEEMANELDIWKEVAK